MSKIETLKDLAKQLKTATDSLGATLSRLLATNRDNADTADDAKKKHD